jgi:DNA-binding GntR family transcriptional regulator
MRSGDRIPDGVLKKIFPKKFNRATASETVYAQLKRMILSGRLKKGQRLMRGEIVKSLNVSEVVVSRAFSQLKKDGLVIIKGRVGSFVA